MLISNTLLLQVVGKYSCRKWVCEWSLAGRGQEEPKSDSYCRGEGKRPVKCEFWQIFLCGFTGKGEWYSSDHAPVP